MLKTGDFVKVIAPANGLGGKYQPIDEQVGKTLPIKEYEVTTNTYLVGNYYYNPECLAVSPAPVDIEPLPVEPEKIEAPQAMRFNSGKPELSYMLDFPKTMKGLLTDIDFDKFHRGNDLFAALMDFQAGIDDHLLPTVIYSLLQQLEQDLTGKNRHPSYYPVEVTTFSDIAAACPQAWNEFVTVCANGALKYERDNWKTGFPYRQLIDCALRHYRKFLHGVKRDELDPKMIDRWEVDSDFRAYFEEDFQAFETRFSTHHLAHVIWNLAVIIEIEEKWDDRNIR